MSTRRAITRGAHHIGLTVPDLNITQEFFVDILGFDVVGEVPGYPAVFLSDGTTMITLWQVENPDKASPFDRKNGIGLHHPALTIESDEVLDVLYQILLTTKGVEIDFSSESLGDGPTRHFIVSIPGGIRVEFIAPSQIAA